MLTLEEARHLACQYSRYGNFFYVKLVNGEYVVSPYYSDNIVAVFHNGKEWGV